MPSRAEARAILADPAEARRYGVCGRLLLWRIAAGLAPVAMIRGGRA